MPWCDLCWPPQTKRLSWSEWTAHDHGARSQQHPSRSHCQAVSQTTHRSRRAPNRCAASSPPRRSRNTSTPTVLTISIPKAPGCCRRANAPARPRTVSSPPGRPAQPASARSSWNTATSTRDRPFSARSTRKPPRTSAAPPQQWEGFGKGNICVLDVSTRVAVATDQRLIRIDLVVEGGQPPASEATALDFARQANVAANDFDETK